MARVHTSQVVGEVTWRTWDSSATIPGHNPIGEVTLSANAVVVCGSSEEAREIARAFTELADELARQEAAGVARKAGPGGGQDA